MSTSITINASLEFNDGNTDDLTEQANAVFTPSTSREAKLQQSIPTTAGGTALNLGGLPSLGWCLLKNLDATNFVSVLTGASGTVIGKVPPAGSYGPVYMGSGLQAPYLLADTAPCLIEAHMAAQ